MILSSQPNNRRNKMTKAEMRKEFEAYYAELVADGKIDGAFFNKAEQWEWFKKNKVDPQA
jgi:hypothetical protein